jgi:probable rRNA maturation factor
MIRILNKRGKHLVSTDWIRTQVSILRNCLYASEFCVGVWMASDKKMKELNAFHRKKNKVTDVLSIPANDSKRIKKWLTDEELKQRVEGFQFKDLGDIIIAVNYVQKQCEDNKWDFRSHLQVLLAHSLCHLIGYVHDTDQEYQVMKKKEEEILAILRKSQNAVQQEQNPSNTSNDVLKKEEPNLD